MGKRKKGDRPLPVIVPEVIVQEASSASTAGHRAEIDDVDVNDSNQLDWFDERLGGYRHRDGILNLLFP